MEMFGYTDTYKVVPVNLFFEEITQNMIDPWRMDLLDPSPVSEPERPLQFRTRGDESEQRLLPALRFQKLRDICFAYCGKDSKINVGVLHGDEAFCVIGSQRQGADTVELSDIELSRRPFSEHYGEYLRQHQWAARSYSFSEKTPSPGCPNHPVRGSAAKLRGATLMIEPFAPAILPGSFTYEGEMFAERRFPLPMNEDINWLLEVLKPWQPAVFGAAIRATLRQEQPEKIDISVGKAAAPAMQFLCQKLNARYLPGLPRCFEEWSTGLVQTDEVVEVRGHEVQIAQRGARSMKDWLMHEGDRCFSADHIYSSQPNQCCGARIALVDISHSQTRLFRRFKDTEQGLEDHHKRRFAKEKMEVLSP